MQKKLIVIFFLLMISILSLCNVMAKRNCIQEKKVLLVGSTICVKYENIIEGNDGKNSKTINTSSQNIGIMTCIDEETGQYFAFGHAISSNNKIADLKGTKCYKTNYIGIEKSSNYKIGKLMAVSNTNSEIGDITENTEKGVLGQVLDISIFNKKEIEEYYIGSSYNITEGPAKIYVDLDGNGLKYYDIIIENVNYFDATRNIQVKVVDNELISKTGGIVKGMSGSPIIQNGKLIGAINCTSEKVPTEAYGIFADKFF